MSNKQRIRPVIDNEVTIAYVVQRCNPGSAWETIKEYLGSDKQEVLQQIHREFPKARFR